MWIYVHNSFIYYVCIAVVIFFFTLYHHGLSRPGVWASFCHLNPLNPQVRTCLHRYEAHIKELPLRFHDLQAKNDATDNNL